MLAVALFSVFATIGSVGAQTTDRLDEVPMPPVIEVAPHQLAKLRAGSGAQDLLQPIVAWLAADFPPPANYQHPRIEFAPPMKMAAVRFSALGAERLPRVLGDAGDERFMRQMRDVVALYEDATRTIYLREDWTGATPAELSVLVHEMVHHLQNIAGLKYGCAQEREKPAYAAQVKFLKLAGRDFFDEFETDPISLMMRTACGY
jgi:hypothetical protein